MNLFHPLFRGFEGRGWLWPVARLARGSSAARARCARTADTLGWEETAEHISASVVAFRVLAAVRPGEIVLMHVGSNPDDHITFDANAPPR